jgi:(S)-2-hydroxy-acid oxidase
MTPTESLSLCNVNDFQKLAKTKLPRELYEYLASGTDDEQTLAENRSAFKMWYLRPRVMRPVEKICTATRLFGQTLKVPFFVSPAGVMAICDNEHGECATARACGRIGAMFGLSQHATRSIEQVASGAPDTNKWYQCYILKDRELTKELLQRAKNAGYNGIFLTVDSPRFGYREADARNGFNALPPPHRLENYEGNNLDLTYNGKEHAAWDQNTEQMFDQALTWADVRWVKEECQLPLVLKGVMTAEDAELAVEAGCDGVMVSNHGGRQLDGCLASIDALSEVVCAVKGRVPVLIDGGFQRGTDILKALALGATAIGIGKPIFFALSVGGEEALEKMFGLLRTELESAMALCGVNAVTEINGSLVARHPTGSAVGHYYRARL